MIQGWADSCETPNQSRPWPLYRAPTRCFHVLRTPSSHVLHSSRRAMPTARATSSIASTAQRPNPRPRLVSCVATKGTWRAGGAGRQGCVGRGPEGLAGKEGRPRGARAVGMGVGGRRGMICRAAPGTAGQLWRGVDGCGPAQSMAPGEISQLKGGESRAAGPSRTSR
jgi:hypothetical protein